MKLAIQLIFALCLSLNVFAENEKGNGGGGVQRDGRYMTFHSAGLYIENAEPTAEEVPQLEEILDFFNNTSYLTGPLKIKYIKALMQSDNRHYYKVKPETFTEEIRERLVDEYVRITEAKKEEIVLFAITDTENGNTYLLPEYYELSAVDQWAILFHEAYWIVNPAATYEDVVDAEVKFQAFVEDRVFSKQQKKPGVFESIRSRMSGEKRQVKSSTKVYNFIKKIADEKELLAASVTYDLESGALSGILKENKYIKMSYLLGEEWIACRVKAFDFRDDEMLKRCYSFIQTHLYKIKKMHPDSMLMQLMFEKIMNENIDYLTQYVLWDLTGDKEKVNKTLVMQLPLYKRLYNTSPYKRDYVNGCGAFKTKYLVLSNAFVHEYALEVVNPSDTEGCENSKAFLSFERMTSYSNLWRKY